MTTQIAYNAEAYRLMKQFDEHLKLYTVRESFFGMNGLGERVEFTPTEFLIDYWTYENVDHLLLSLSGTNFVAHDITLILSDYIVVFSILTKMRKPDWIRQFVAHQIKDSSLPRRDSNMPKSWTDEFPNNDIWPEFINEQWRFCPYMFDRLSDAELSESYILPIQSKEFLQSKANEGDLAILYKVKLHPACRGELSEYIVFKEYQRTDPIAAETYNNERSIYTSLQPESKAFKNIIQYYGSFQMLGKRTIMLEYADGGDLLTFFMKVDPPSKVEHITAFWTNFFELLHGLEAVHNLEPPSSGKEDWLREGIHQDIRPQNILLIQKPASSHPYDVTFKLVDFGTGYIKKQSLDQLRRRHRDNLGNATYSSPESVNNRLHPESDVWALGALASETLIWTIKGWAGVLEYSSLRRAKAGQGLEDTHHTCFHDGIHRLSIIDDHHRETLKDKLAEDKISSLVSEVILEHMLVEHHSTGGGRDSPNWRFRRGSGETHRLWQERLSAISLTDSTSTSDSPRHVQHPVMEPVLTTAEPGTYSQPSELDLEGPTGPTRYFPGGSRIPHRPRHTLHEGFSRPLHEGLSQPLHNRHSVHHGPSQTHLWRLPNLLSEDPPEAALARRRTQTRDRRSIIQDLMETLDHTLDGTDMQHDPPRFDNDPVTIETIYNEFIAQKDGKNKVGAAISRLRRFSNDQNDPLKVHRELGRAMEKLKNSGSGSSGREQVFLVDDSESMSNLQIDVAKTVRVLTYLIKKGDVDPDRSIELRFASQIGRRTQNSNSKPLEDAIKGWTFDDSVCEMGTALETLLLSILPKPFPSDPKPVSVYVLTNGLWSDKNSTSLCGVDEAIEVALRRLDDNRGQLSKNWLGIQFIGFFDGLSEFDNKIGRDRLQFLDDKLGELFEALELGISRKDIVDTREWGDDVKDILLGAVSKAVDRKESEGRRLAYMPPQMLQ